jgi:hypothetical protein
MGNFTGAEHIRYQIRNHSHYGSCLNGWRYSKFLEKSSELDTCLKYENEVTKLKEDIIEEYNNLKNKEKAREQSWELFNKECDEMKENFKSEENMEIEKNDKMLENLKEKTKNIEEEGKKKLEELEKDINNLKEKIELLKEKEEEGIERRKEEILNNLQHKYELSLERYEMEKKYQKMQKEEKMKLKIKEIEAKKEIEFAELKNKSDFVNKIFYCFKINNFIINI